MPAFVEQRRRLMSLTMAIFMMIMAWLLVASAMLWGVLRIARRHYHPAPAAPVVRVPHQGTRPARGLKQRFVMTH
jgi:hypothetical protein